MANNDIKHTKEPWGWFDDESHGVLIMDKANPPQKDLPLGVIAGTSFSKNTIEDAKRIVAAVNFCEGVSTEALIAGDAVIVPVEPTEEIIERGIDEFDNIYDPDVPREFLFKEIYKAMTEGK